MINKWKRSRAFTLVELLVVVAIIALLVSILLPSLGKAKEQAKMVVCMSNLKSLSLGFVFYTHENDEWYPMGTGIYLWPPYWDGILRDDKFIEPGLLHCPSDPPNGHSSCGYTRQNLWENYRNTPVEDRFARSYGINCDVSYYGPNVNGEGEWPGSVHKASEVTLPNDTILLGEMWYWWSGSESCWMPGMHREYDAFGIHTAISYNPGGRDATADVHRNKDVANYLFCDGHVITLHKDNPKLTEEEDHYYYKREKE